jgi:hypothetical protein
VCNKLKSDGDAKINEKDKKYILKCNERCEAKKKLENERKNGENTVQDDNESAQSAQSSSGSPLIQPAYLIVLAAIVLFASILAFYFIK